MANTTNDFIQKLEQRYKDIVSNKPLGIAVAAVHEKMVKRIFEDGKNGNDGKIGAYDTSEPLYVSPNKSPKSFPVKGKTGKTKYKNGKPHKTGYFTSYKAFRQKIGREVSFVNLSLFGQLKRDFSNSLQRVNNNKWISGTKNNKNSDKVDGAVDRYGREVFQLTKDEKKLLLGIIKIERIKIGL